jgi:hypothetical protein
MPFAKTGSCPFAGSHWPSQWGEQKLSAKKFSLLHSDQKRDLIQYFFEHDSQKTSARSQPAYRFPLTALRDYFGAHTHDLRKAVMQSEEYKAFFTERQRLQAQPPPPEMSLLTAARIAACLAMDPPKEDERARWEGDHARDREERMSASVAQVVRQADRQAAGIICSKGPPRKDGMYETGGSTDRTHHYFDFEKDKTRGIVCDMQATINEAVDKKIGDFDRKQKEIFGRLVQEEIRKNVVKTGKTARTDARAPYKARAALGLILLLSSTLW